MSVDCCCAFGSRNSLVNQRRRLIKRAATGGRVGESVGTNLWAISRYHRTTVPPDHHSPFDFFFIIIFSFPAGPNEILHLCFHDSAPVINDRLVRTTCAASKFDGVRWRKSVWNAAVHVHVLFGLIRREKSTVTCENRCQLKGIRSSLSRLSYCVVPRHTPLILNYPSDLMHADTMEATTINIYEFRKQNNCYV